MDLDDLIGRGATKGPARSRKFVPGTNKPKPPKQESAPPKPEPGDSVTVKPEPWEVPSGAVKMEVETTKPEEEVAGTALNKGDLMDVEEEDMVVRDIDVFFNPLIGPDTQLFVMQYPLRPSWRPYELDERCKEVRVKPGTSEFEVDMSVHDSSNWDVDTASRMKMEKQMLYTRWEPCPMTNYAVTVAVLTGNKLYLNPVQSVVQLRPSLEHINPGCATRKNKPTIDGEVTVKVEGSIEAKHSGPSKKQNKRPESENELMSVEESWIPLKYHGSKSDFSASYLQKMVAEENSSINFTMSPYAYMSSICPVPSDNTKNKGPSRRLLLSLPVEERIKKLLLEGSCPVQRFSALEHYASDCSTEELLRILQECGVLVQGLWMAKTTLIYAKPCPESIAREYVLLLFSKNLVVSSWQFDLPRIKGDLPRIKAAVNDFRKKFAEEQSSSRDWKFIKDRDASFIELYPEVVLKQEAAWTGTEKRLNDFFGHLEGKSAMNNVITKPPITGSPGVKPLNSDQGMAKGVRGASHKRTITDETRDALLKALPKVLQNHKVCSFELICQGLRDLAISQSTLPKADPRMAVAAASGADAPPAELQEVISEVATNIHGFYVLKSSPDHPDCDPLRKVVINLFLARGPNGKLKKAEVMEAARLALKREVSNNEYNKVMTDFCVSKGSAWCLKSGDGKPS